MRLHSDQHKKKDPSSELIDAGRELLSSPDFSVRDNSYDHHLHTIANVCLSGVEGSVATRLLCERIKQEYKDSTFRVYNHHQLLESIFRLQPRIALDVFLGGAPQSDSFDFRGIALDALSDRRKNPLDEIPIEEMFRWCDEKPAERYPAISRIVSYQNTSKVGEFGWTPLAMEMLKRAPDPLTVLKTFVKRFSPSCWSGSRAAIVESRLGLLDCLGELKNASLDNYATEIRPKLLEDIAQMRKSEDESDIKRDERFE